MTNKAPQTAYFRAKTGSKTIEISIKMCVFEGYLRGTKRDMYRKGLNWKNA